MAQITYRGNLTSRTFPLIAEFQGRTVIVGQQDQNMTAPLQPGDSLGADKGTPQLYYCHNVMPSADGYQSIGYTQEILDFKVGFNDIHLLRDTEGNSVYFTHTNLNVNYVLILGNNFWTQTTNIPEAAGKKVSIATISGQTFIYFESVGCYLYDVVTNSLISIEMLGLETDEILGITSSAGYMIAWSSNSVAWSSAIAHDIPTDPIDFVPSLATGAGGGNVELAKGKITFCMTHYLGFIIYTTGNAVAAVYSGQSRFPFNFREIIGTGGLSSNQLVAIEGVGGNHYAYTTSGMQLISVSAAQTVFPDITDFISGKYFEDFNEITLKFLRTTLAAPMKKAINVISDRYLVISYGIIELTHALIFDLVQKRFGKVKLNHVKCFEFISRTEDVVDIPRQSIGFLQSNGSIRTIDFSYSSITSSGVMLIGKFQYTRSRNLQLDEVAIENVKEGSNFSLYNYPSLDGKNYLDVVPGYLSVSTGAFRNYLFSSVGLNHTLLFLGKFYATSFELVFHRHGSR